MDEVTQQNAALVEEAAAAASSLEEQGRRLNEAVAFFTVEAQTPTFMRAAASVTRAPVAKKPAPRVAPVAAAKPVSADGWSAF
jgi:methyl-accepting chemotaxis protein-1 (serine sensor receptor)